MGRSASIKRDTKETKISIFLDLDDKNTERNVIETGCGFMDHMLTLMAAHGNFRFDVACQGDTYIDYHHSVEDIGIAFGQAFREAIGDMKGIARYGDIILPMDETLILEALDISGRSYLNFDVVFPTEKVGDMDTELFKEFFLAFVRKAEVTLHIKELEGENSHHIAEGCFKAFGRVLAKGFALDTDNMDRIPSTKGMLV